MSPHHFLAFPLTENLCRHIVFFRPRGQFFETVNLVRFLKGLLEEELKKILELLYLSNKNLIKSYKLVTNQRHKDGLFDSCTRTVQFAKIKYEKQNFLKFLFRSYKRSKKKMGFC